MKQNREFRKREVLPGGIRLLSERIPHVRSIALGVWYTTGSRDEARGEYGISHLIEHMVFKGTTNRSTEEIASSLESLGGHLDAFTTKESTCYTARVLDEHLPAAVDVLGDILQNSLFLSEELEKEKKVILEEMKSSEDSPDEVSFEVLTKAVFNGHPLSIPILGTRKSLRNVKRKKIQARIKKSYIPSRMVVAAAGNVHHQELSELIQKTFHLRHIPSSKFHAELDSAPNKSHPESSSGPIPNSPRLRSRKRRDISQVHVSLGTATIPYGHPDRYALTLLNTIFGGSMSSRLFQKVREERGLVYAIHSFPVLYTDVGLWGIYFAADPKKYKEAAQIVFSEFKQLRREGLRKDELSNAKAQVKGNLTLSLESTSQRMYRLAQSEIYLGKFFSTDETLRKIDRVRPEEVMRLAETLLDPSQISISIVGPVSKPRWGEFF